MSDTSQNLSKCPATAYLYLNNLQGRQERDT